MQEKLLKKIITDFAGAGTEKLVDLLHNKQNVNEFLIAKKMDMTINQTRNMLYRLGDEGLVRFIRKKDKKKGGWYTYFWTLETEKSLLKYKEITDSAIKKLKEGLIKRQNERFFYCKNCDIEYNEESALLNDYTCPECGEIVEMKNPQDTIKHIEVELKKLNETLKEINIELEVVGKKKEKSKERRLKAEKKKKELERLKRKKERELEKKKLLKGKPAPKKKAKKKAKKTKKKKLKKSKKPKKKIQKKKVKKSKKAPRKGKKKR